MSLLQQEQELLEKARAQFQLVQDLKLAHSLYQQEEEEDFKQNAMRQAKEIADKLLWTPSDSQAALIKRGWKMEDVERLMNWPMLPRSSEGFIQKDIEPLIFAPSAVSALPSKPPF